MTPALRKAIIDDGLAFLTLVSERDYLKNTTERQAWLAHFADVLDTIRGARTDPYHRAKYLNGVRPTLATFLSPETLVELDKFIGID